MISEGKLFIKCNSEIIDMRFAVDCDAVNRIIIKKSLLCFRIKEIKQRLSMFNFNSFKEHQFGLRPGSLEERKHLEHHHQFDEIYIFKSSAYAKISQRC